MKKIDWKKAKSLLITYATPTLPLAAAAFQLNASNTVKILTFLSGALAVIARQVNPKDPFTCNLFHIAQEEVDAELAKATKKAAKPKATPKA